jgi:hypothetical protein
MQVAVFQPRRRTSSTSCRRQFRSRVFGWEGSIIICPLDQSSPLHLPFTRLERHPSSFLLVMTCRASSTQLPQQLLLPKSQIAACLAVPFLISLFVGADCCYPNCINSRRGGIRLFRWSSTRLLCCSAATTAQARFRLAGDRY